MKRQRNNFKEKTLHPSFQAILRKKNGFNWFHDFDMINVGSQNFFVLAY